MSEIVTLEPEKRQRVDATLNLLNWISSRLKDRRDEDALIELIIAHLDAAHDEGLRDAQWIIDKIKDASHEGSKSALSIASKAIADFRSVNEAVRNGE